MERFSGITLAARMTRRRLVCNLAASCLATSIALSIASAAFAQTIDGAAVSGSSATPTASARLEPLRIRAGEHGTFSRLVIETPENADWRSTSTSQSATVRIDTPNLSFNDDEVVRRRMAHRVVSVDIRTEGSESVLDFGLNCDCKVKTSQLNNRQILVDISPTERRSASDASFIATGGDASAAVSSEAAKQAKVPTASLIDEDEAEEEARAPDEQSGDDPATIERARQILLKQLQRAADEGLIAFRDNASKALQQPIDAPAVTDAEAPDNDVEAQTSPSEGAPALGATTPDTDPPVQPQADTAPNVQSATDDAPAALRAALQSLTSQEPPNAEALASRLVGATKTTSEKSGVAMCVPNDALDPVRWRGTRDFYEELSAHRRRLYNDVNLADAGAVADLARFYLSYGLGEEAAKTPRAFAIDTPATRLTNEMAAILIGKPLDTNSLINKGVGCGGRHAIWRAAHLAQSNPQAAIEAYREEPEALILFRSPHRRLFGARIGRAAIDAGDFALAAEILEILQRNSDAPTREMLWIEVELALNNGSPNLARGLLREIMNARGPDAPLAAIRYALTLDKSAPQKAVKEISEILQDYALQYRGSETGRQIVEAEAELIARFGGLGAGVDHLNHISTHTPIFAPALRKKRLALIEVEIAAAIDEPTPERMSAAVKAAGMIGDERSADTIRIALAETLLANGAHALAQLVLPDFVTDRSETARQLLADANDESTLLPSTPNSDRHARALEELRNTKAPSFETDRRLEVGYDIIDTLDAELQLLQEITSNE